MLCLRELMKLWLWPCLLGLVSSPAPRHSPVSPLTPPLTPESSLNGSATRTPNGFAFYT